MARSTSMEQPGMLPHVKPYHRKPKDSGGS